MFHPHQSSSSPLPLHFPSRSQILNADPSSFLSLPPLFYPSGIAPEPSLHPPGTDPHANSGLLAPSFVGLEGRRQFYADPNAGPHNWVVTQPEPGRFAFKSVHENLVTSTSSNPLWNGHYATPSLEPGGATRIRKDKSKFQPLQCEVCKIQCNSRDVFDKHVLGKKHRKNLELQNSSLAVTTSSDSNINMLSQMPDISGQMLLGTSHVNVSEDLEAKKRKLIDYGTTIDSVRVCTVCNIVCNSPEVFNKHLRGKRHAAQAGLISQNPNAAAIRTRYNSSLKKKPKMSKVVQSAWCEVCKVNCNSTEIYAKHLEGKKHLKNIEKLEKEKVDATTSNALPSSTDPVIGPVEDPAAKKVKSNGDAQKKKKSSAQAPEDLETKKRKIVESGATAGAVKTCTICNVVCNSQTVFNFHLAGQKHAAMVRKQAESGSSMPDPPLETALLN